MNRTTRRSLRPDVERVEGRCLTTAHVASHGLEHVAPAVAHHHPAPHPAAQHPARHHHQKVKHPGMPASGPIGQTGIPGFRLPANFQNWGVVTLWNNTGLTATYSISASTFHGGQYYPFSLKSGGVQSYFAPVVNGQAPLFQVRFNNQSSALPLAQDNIVFDSPSYVPSSTAGYPYAIQFGLNAFSITSI